MRVRTAVGAAVAGVLMCWVATPLVSLARTGTIDQRASLGWRDEARQAESARRASREREAREGIPSPRAAPAPAARRHPPVSVSSPPVMTWGDTIEAS